MTAQPKLPKVFKRKWVSALRSGKFSQGRGELFDGQNYCCLGVAAKICNAPANLISERTLLTEGMIPQKAFEILSEIYPRYDEIQMRLAQKNDKGWSFNRIATWIEKHL